MNDDNLADKMRMMFERMQHEQEKQIKYGLAEGWLQYKVGPSGTMHLSHTLPEDLGVDTVSVFTGLEDVLEEIAAIYGVM
jgi:hypothetical protein